MSKVARNRQRSAREKVVQMRAQQRRAERRRNLITLGAIVEVAGAVIGVVIAALPSGGSGKSSSKEVIPSAVTGGTPVVQPAALVVPSISGIRGVIAYDTTGWPASSHNGPAARALRHNHVPGPVTAAGLAERTGLHPRWLLEWLRGQAAAGLIGSADGEVFEFSPEVAALLADEDTSLWFAAGAFHGAAATPGTVERLAESFRTGRGLSFDDFGPEAAGSVERTLGPWSRLALVPTILPALDGVTARLEAGARVADVGCGSGVTLLTLAAAFPRSEFDGYDPSRHAIERAERHRASQHLANARFHHEAADDLPAGPVFDLVLTFDCLHDMPHPDRAAQAVGRCLKVDGTWLIKEIRAGETWQDNLAHPVAAMFYGSSVASCLPSGLSEPGGAGLGTLGLPPSRVEGLCRDAGFGRFTVHDVADPANLHFEVRP